MPSAAVIMQMQTFRERLLVNDGRILTLLTSGGASRTDTRWRMMGALSTCREPLAPCPKEAIRLTSEAGPSPSRLERRPSPRVDEDLVQ
jgi:hypothetical protein